MEGVTLKQDAPAPGRDGLQNGVEGTAARPEQEQPAEDQLDQA